MSPALHAAMKPYFEGQGFVPGLDHVDAGMLAAAIASLGPSNMELIALFKRLDEVLLDVTPKQRNLLVVGLLEGLQSQAINAGQSFDMWTPMLGPIATTYWNAIAAVWRGEMAPDDFNQLVENGIAGD